MAFQDALAGALLLLLLAIGPPLLLVLRVRHVEKARREPWSALRRAFLWGALAATLASVILEPVLTGYLEAWWTAALVPLGTVVVAPVVEEVAKAAGLLGVRDADPEPEDGFVYGAAAGLGFAATENVLYVTVAYFLGGQESAIVTGVYRAVATVALHAAATAVAGYGLWRARYHGGSVLLAAGAVAGAILLHAAYNALASAQGLLAVLLAVALAVLAYARVERRIRALDRGGA